MQQIQPIIQKECMNIVVLQFKPGAYIMAEIYKKILVNDRKNTKYALKLDVKKFIHR